MRNDNIISLLALGDGVPDFLGDERHEGVQQQHQVLEELDGGSVGHGVDALALRSLHHLEVPRAEVVPSELVDAHQGIAQAVLVDVVVGFGQHLVEARLKPLDGHLGSLGLGGVFIHIPAFHETQGVPNLVAEVAALLAEGLVEEDVVAGRGAEHHAHTYAIGTKLVDEFNRIRRVAQRLGHLAA